MSNLPPMPLLPFTTDETLSLCSSLELEDNDIFICSYPKSGTTWTQHIVISLLLCHRKNNEISTNNKTYDHVSKFAPFFEVNVHWDEKERRLRNSIRENHTWLGFRIFNTHLRWDMLPKNISKSAAQKRKPKFIYLVRSPLDVCVSFYHHLSNQHEGGYKGDFNQFFSEWLNGEIPFGSWIDHISSFMDAFKSDFSDQNFDVCLISYEEMLSNLPEVIDRLVNFLQINVSPEQKLQILPTLSFQSMKSNLDKFQPRSVTWKNNFEFLRKGIHGDHVNLISTEQKDSFRKSLVKSNLREMIGRTHDEKIRKDLMIMINEFLKPSSAHN